MTEPEFHALEPGEDWTQRLATDLSNDPQAPSMDVRKLVKAVEDLRAAVHFYKFNTPSYVEVASDATIRVHYCGAQSANLCFEGDGHFSLVFLPYRHRMPVTRVKIGYAVTAGQDVLLNACRVEPGENGDICGKVVLDD